MGLVISYDTATGKGDQQYMCTVLQGSMNYQYEKKKNPMASKQPGIVPIVTMYIGVSEIADDD